MNEMNHEIDKALMERARKIVQKKHDLLINTICYATINLLLVFIWYITGAGYFWPLWCMLGWGFGLVVMTIEVVHYIKDSGQSDKVEKEYQRLMLQKRGGGHSGEG